jgi:REP element-mobilizing transposase RayT
MPPCIAYHVIWTCYGQWLHGDARGSVDRSTNIPGTPYAPADPQRRSAAANRMAEATCWLTDDQRRIATRALREACEFRGWRLEAVNVQPDHTHVVVQAEGVTGIEVRRILKGRSTTWLHEQVGGRRTWWTEGGKTEHIRDGRHLVQAIAYVNDQRFPKVEA